MKKGLLMVTAFLLFFIVAAQTSSAEAAGTYKKTSYKPTKKVAYVHKAKMKAKAKPKARHTTYNRAPGYNYKMKKGSAYYNGKPSYVAHVRAAQYQAPSHRSMTMTTDSSGRALVRWDSRGGECQIAYTESAAPHQEVFQYRTVANCDQAQQVIGGLQPGRQYTFTVSQNGHTWAQPDRAVATTAMLH
jgi:hypothetical protein